MVTKLLNLKRLWSEEDGFIVSAELILISTVLVLSLIVGLCEVRTSITSELVDIANAFGCVNQSFHSHDHGDFKDHSHQFGVELHGHSHGGHGG